MAEQTRFCVVDLTGSRLGPDYLSVECELRVDVDAHPADRIRWWAAKHYGVPLEQVGQLTPAPQSDDWAGEYGVLIEGVRA